MNKFGTFIDTNKKNNMRNIYISLILFIISGSVNSQTTFSEEFSKIKTELINWDQIRGEWLGSSIVAMAEKNTIPDRTFPEEFTPYQMATMIPMEKRKEISMMLDQSRSSRNNLFSNQWQTADLIFNHSFCSTITGRSYGDPHLNSFDKASYSFQTVGEFVVSKSLNNNFEVQARQSPQSSNFSLNTAIAMNVAGDRLCYYSNEKPDSHFSSWRLDGQPLQLNGRTYFLPHGGTISLVGRYYTIAWPTGETVVIENRSNEFSFVNLTIQVFGCDQGNFEGLLGNANGIMDDDFNGKNLNRQRPVYASFSSFGNPLLQQASANAEREYLNFLSKDFAEDWRVTDENTLFDYGIGKSTHTYTDRSFPSEHFTVSDLPSNKQEAARKKCEGMGISPEEMRGCIFDQGFLNINPNPIPSPNIPTRDISLTKLDRPIINNNIRTYHENAQIINSGEVTPIKNPSNINNPEQHLEERSNNKPIDKVNSSIDQPKSSFENSKPKLNENIKPSAPVSKPSNSIPSNPVQKSNIGSGIKVIKG